jgi:ABC-type uncharacterized transport system involved in gliding motility auxiliary subunit
MIMVDPGVDTGLAPLFSRWGVEAGKAYAAEGDPQAMFRSPFIPVVFRMAQHKVTEKIGLPVVFLAPTYLTVPPPGQGPPGWRVTSLAQTTDRSWAETDENGVRNPQAVKYDEGVDTKGPLTLAAAIEQNPDPATPGADPNTQSTSPKSRVLVFSTSRLASNEVFQLGQIANMDVFVNGSSWLVGDDELISIQPRPTDTRTLFLTAAQRNFIMLSSIVLVPALVLAVGILIWWGRR